MNKPKYLVLLTTLLAVFFFAMIYTQDPVSSTKIDFKEFVQYMIGFTSFHEYQEAVKTNGYSTILLDSIKRDTKYFLPSYITLFIFCIYTYKDKTSKKTICVAIAMTLILCFSDIFENYMHTKYLLLIQNNKPFDNPTLFNFTRFISCLKFALFFLLAIFCVKSIFKNVNH